MAHGQEQHLSVVERAIVNQVKFAKQVPMVMERVAGQELKLGVAILNSQSGSPAYFLGKEKTQ